MRKIIMGINVTPDGFCDHRAGIADGELHKYYSELLKNADTILFGRKTFRLMEDYWPDVAKNNIGTKEEIEFAELIDDIHKIVYSKAGINSAWKNTTILNDLNSEEILKLKQTPGKNILVGSPSIISQMAGLELIDEYYFLVHPLIAGRGKRFFETGSLDKYVNLKLNDTKIFKSGAIALQYRTAD
jgi:dihydrofolate reductase